MSTKRRISVIGRGVDPAKHLSLAAIRALRQADKAIGIEPETEAWNQLRMEFSLPPIEDVSHLYQDGSNDLANYDRFINHVFQLSNQMTNLAVLVAGHPRLGVSFIERLKKAASPDTEITVVEAVSSFDVMIKDMELDPIERGTALLDVNRLLLFKYALEPALGYFMYHVCSVGNPKTNYSNASIGNRIDILRNYLMKFYQPSKVLFLCKASNGANEESSSVPCELSNLENMASLIDFGTSLYIPPEKPSRLDHKYLELLR